MPAVLSDIDGTGIRGAREPWHRPTTGSSLPSSCRIAPLVAQVAKEDQRIAMPGRQRFLERDGFACARPGVAEHDAIAAMARFAGDGFDERARRTDLRRRGRSGRAVRSARRATRAQADSACSPPRPRPSERAGGCPRRSGRGSRRH